MRRLLSILLLLLMAATPFTAPARACVGKTLQVGVVPGVEEKLMTRMLSILVNERTGTSVKIREFGSFEECFIALNESEIDLVIAFSGQGFARVSPDAEAVSPEMVFEEVKGSYNREYNLVWLEPWGVTDGGRFLKDGSGDPLVTQAAPLVRKDALKKFPALARLVNKMSGRLDQASMASLLEGAGGQDLDRAARQFLKSEKLI